MMMTTTRTTTFSRRGCVCLNLKRDGTFQGSFDVVVIMTAGQARVAMVAVQ